MFVRFLFEGGESLMSRWFFSYNLIRWVNFAILLIVVAACKDITPPNTPMGVVANIVENGIEIAWNKTPRTDSYAIYKSNTDTDFSNSPIGNSSDNKFHDDKPLYGNNYYRVRAINDGGYSEYSKIVYCNYNPAPTSVSAIQNGNTITISWSTVTEVATFKIYRSKNAEGTYSQIGESNSTIYIDNSPLIENNFYRIVSVGTAGESAQSNYSSCNFSPNNGYVYNPDGIELIFVEGGTFMMGCGGEQGSDCNSDERPQHSVTLSSFYIGKYPITQAQWKVIIGWDNPSHFKGENLPVELISWNHAQAFITKLNTVTGKQYRLATEAEWEYAARGGNKSKGYKYSGSNNLNDVAWYSTNSGSSSQPVGTKQSNELGIYDMSGNVWEWCQDWYDTYPSSTQSNPTGPPSGFTRVFRGGSWYNSAVFCRVSHRSGNAPDDISSIFGFRVVLPLSLRE